MADRPRRDETPELRRLRRRIDALDRRIVRLLNERTLLGLSVGAEKASGGGKSRRDAERETEVLLRVAAANEGPLPQSDILALYRRLMAVTRRVQRDRLGASKRREDYLPER